MVFSEWAYMRGWLPNCDFIILFEKVTVNQNKFLRVYENSYQEFTLLVKPVLTHAMERLKHHQRSPRTA